MRRKAQTDPRPRTRAVGLGRVGRERAQQRWPRLAGPASACERLDMGSGEDRTGARLDPTLARAARKLIVNARRRSSRAGDCRTPREAAILVVPLHRSGRSARRHRRGMRGSPADRSLAGCKLVVVVREAVGRRRCSTVQSSRRAELRGGRTHPPVRGLRERRWLRSRLSSRWVHLSGAVRKAYAVPVRCEPLHVRR